MDNLTDGSFSSFRRLVERLRGEDGCPWDQKQTSKTIGLYLIEEVYELIDAMENGGSDEICEELGDVLFHIVFLVDLFQGKGHLTFTDIIRNITEKMIRRHPHVFGDKQLENSGQVRDQWREIKKEEKGTSGSGSVLDSVPTALPALMRAHRISERAVGIGFDWDDMKGVMEKVEEEWFEFKDAFKGKNQRSGSIAYS